MTAENAVESTTQQLLDLNEPELPHASRERLQEPQESLENHRTIESIWPPHTCGKSESAVAISCCSFGVAIGMLILYGLCNF